jgi:chitin synthase
VATRLRWPSLGFKPTHVTYIFSLLIATLELGNLRFTEDVSREDTAHAANLMELEHAATLLGVALDELAQALTTKTSHVRRELCTNLLNPERSVVQRDQLVRDLYVILFAFVMETANHKLAPSPQETAPHVQITLLDQPGYQ